MKRDLARFAAETRLRLVLGFLVIAVFGGGGLVWLFFGPSAAGLAVVCVLAGILPIVLILALLLLAEKVVRRGRP
jgi:hypothetical protein